MKNENIKFRCSIYEKKQIQIRAKRAGLSVSEFCRKSVFESKIIERFSEDEIQIYKMLIQYHNNFKFIGNMYRNRAPHIESEVLKLSSEIKEHLKKFNK